MQFLINARNVLLLHIIEYFTPKLIEELLFEVDTPVYNISQFPFAFKQIQKLQRIINIFGG